MKKLFITPLLLMFLAGYGQNISMPQSKDGKFFYVRPGLNGKQDTTWLSAFSDHMQTYSGSGGTVIYKPIVHDTVAVWMKEVVFNVAGVPVEQFTAGWLSGHEYLYADRKTRVKNIVVYSFKRVL